MNGLHRASWVLLDWPLPTSLIPASRSILTLTHSLVTSLLVLPLSLVLSLLPMKGFHISFPLARSYFSTFNHQESLSLHPLQLFTNLHLFTLQFLVQSLPQRPYPNSPNFLLSHNILLFIFIQMYLTYTFNLSFKVLNTTCII